MAEFKADTRFSIVGELTPDTPVLGQPAEVWQETFAGEVYQRNLDAALCISHKDNLKEDVSDSTK